jgi:hypothetical protein
MRKRIELAVCSHGDNKTNENTEEKLIRVCVHMSRERERKRSRFSTIMIARTKLLRTNNKQASRPRAAAFFLVCFLLILTGYWLLTIFGEVSSPAPSVINFFFF